MQIIRKNFYTVIKLWVNQFGSMFLGILLLLPAAGGPDWLLPAASGFVAIFYLVLIFWVCCELGLRDSVSIEIGKTKRVWYTGTLLALVANSVSILASIVSCVSKALIPGVDYLSSASKATGVFANVYALSTVVNEILHLMYRGLLIFFKLGNYPFIYLPIVLLSVIDCTLGYLAGTKGMFASLFSKKKPE